MNKELIIEAVVLKFYTKATSDFLIGYQFRKISTAQGIDPLAPPIEGFMPHISRINDFWKQILLGKKKGRFEIFHTHKKLNPKLGEFNRWSLLFDQSLEECKNEHDFNQDQLDFLARWKEKKDQITTKLTKDFFPSALN